MSGFSDMKRIPLGRKTSYQMDRAGWSGLEIRFSCVRETEV
jgi:hypothetical protein